MEKDFLSFYRMSNTAEVFSDIFSELELPKGKASAWQVEAMQAGGSAHVSASFNSWRRVGSATLLLQPG